MIRKIQKMLKRRCVYRSTFNELNSLSNKELADIGVSRSEIHYIADKHAKSHV